MNLGGFAGGLASGYQAGARLKLAQQDAADTKDYRSRTLQIQEDEAAVKAAERDKDAKFKTQYQDLFKQYATEQEIPDGEDVIQQPDGTTVKQPRMKKLASMYKDPSRLAMFQIESGALLAGRNPEKAMELAKDARQSLDEATGQMLMNAITTNNFVEVGKKFGFDGSKAKMVVDATDPNRPSTVLDLGNGKKFDMRTPLAALSVKRFADTIDKTETKYDARLTAKSNLAKDDSIIANNNAQRTILIPAQAQAQLASAGNSSASANQTDVETGNLKKGLPKDGGAAKQLDAVKATADILVKSDSFKILSSDMQKTTNRYAQYLVTERGMNPADAALTAISEAQKKHTKGK